MARYAGGSNRVSGLTRKEAAHVLTYLKGKGDPRNVLLWTLGISTGLRISDLLTLTWGEFIGPDGEIVDTITVREKKTARSKRPARTIHVSAAAKDALRAFAKSTRPGLGDSLFTGPSGAVITREQARRLVKAWCEECGLTGDFGTHTMRKTFATVAYENSGGDPVATARVTGHSNPSQLLHYIGKTAKTEENIWNALDKAF